MNNTIRNASIVLVFSMILLGLLLLDYMALHDIRNDYISHATLEHLGFEGASDLPAWTNTQMEWAVVTIGFYGKTLLTMINIILLVFIVRKGKSL